MSSEALQRYQLGTRMAQARMALQNGQVLFSLTERIKNKYAENGIQLKQDQAESMAAGVILAEIAKSAGEGDSPSGTTTPTTGHAGDSSFGPVQHTPPLD